MTAVNVEAKMAPTGPKGAPIRPSINQALLPGSGPNLAIKIWEFTDEQVGTVVSTAALQSSCPGFESTMAHNVQGDFQLLEIMPTG